MKTKIILTTIFMLMNIKIYSSDVNESPYMHIEEYYDLSVLQSSADLGDIVDQYKLSFLYFEGNGTDKDIEKSIYWLNKSANGGYDEAQRALGLIYLSDHIYKKNIDKSIHYLTLSANQGNLESKYALGMIYSNIDSLHYDIDLSVNFLRSASENGHIESVYSLGVILYENYNEKESIELFNISANSGHLNSQINLSYLKFNKEDPDYLSAYFWASIAKSSGSEKNNDIIKISSSLLSEYDLKKADIAIEIWLSM